MEINTETHVRHHNDLTDDDDDNKDKRRVRYDVIGIIFATLIINIAGFAWMASNVGKQINSPEHIEAIKK